MTRTTLFLGAMLLTAMTPITPSRLHAIEVLIETESFTELGGWLHDPYSMDIMGSPYLLAHGLGKPVKNARTTVTIPEEGTYHIWVRTKDWVPSHHPGRFKVIIDGQALPREFGASGKGWSWEHGGDIVVSEDTLTIELEDLTGFDGRCDAIVLSTDPSFSPPARSDRKARAWRRRLLGHPEIPPAAGSFDVVVVGGGIPGCSAALAAARLGCRVALVQNRPVLGGNASTEIGITPRGILVPPVSELVQRGRDHAIRAEQILRAEERVKLFLNFHAYDVDMDDQRITAVSARNTRSHAELSFRAPVFIDATGMAAIGSLAGADCRFGREARSEFNESLAPEKSDTMHHGNTIIFNTRLASESVKFPAAPWATAISKGYADLGGQILTPGNDNRAGPVIGSSHSNGLTHYWEYGQWLDPYTEGERIRDHLLRAVYGTFATVKQRAPDKFAKLELAHVGHIPASGEYRRLVGEYILTENDIRGRQRFPDTVAINSGHICLHYPGNEYDFRLGDWKWIVLKPFEIPFRSLYSRNITNLMMAGKHISVTHIAGAATKTMLNGGQHGIAVGCAAYLCMKHKTLPREISKKHIGELQDIVRGKGAYRDALRRR